MRIQDRRIFPRKRVALSLEGVTNSGSVDPASHGRLRLVIQDLSLGGLSAVVDQPIVKNSRMAVFFPPQHPCRGALASGKVIRCDRDVEGYRISIEFDRFPERRGRMPYTDRALVSACA